MDMRETNRKVVDQFRAGAEIPGMHRDRLLLLTTTGRRSGRRHTTPMMFARVDGELYVIASNAGATSHPAWYRNLAANPRVKVEIGDEAYEATAEPLEGAAREQAWTAITEQFPFFLEHETRARRSIPVVRLTTTRSEADPFR